MCEATTAGSRLFSLLRLHGSYLSTPHLANCGGMREREERRGKVPKCVTIVRQDAIGRQDGRVVQDVTFRS